MESAVWYWDAGHGKRREEMICVLRWILGYGLGIRPTSDAK